MIGSVKNFDSNKIMFLNVDDNKLLKKYNKVLGINSNLLNKEFVVNLFMVKMIVT